MKIELNEQEVNDIIFSLVYRKEYYIEALDYNADIEQREMNINKIVDFENLIKKLKNEFKRT